MTIGRVLKARCIEQTRLSDAHSTTGRKIAAGYSHGQNLFNVAGKLVHINTQKPLHPGHQILGDRSSTMLGSIVTIHTSGAVIRAIFILITDIQGVPIILNCGTALAY